MKGSRYLSRARPISELRESFVSVSLFGPNGAGKTSFACQFPKPLLLLAIEASPTGGALSVSGGKKTEWSDTSGVLYERCEKTEDILGFAEELMEISHGWKTVVVDGPPNWERIVLSEIQGLSKPLEQISVGKVSPDEYIYRSEKMKNYMRPFFDLAKKMNVVVISNEKDHNAERDRSKSVLQRGTHSASRIGPDVGAGFANWLTDWSNHSVQLFTAEVMELKTEDYGSGPQQIEVGTGKQGRFLRLNKHPNYMTRCRTRDDNGPIPDIIRGTSPAELYANFMKAIQ